MMVATAPVGAAERMDVLDVVRGIAVFGILLGLLAATVVVARFDLGAWNWAVAMSIAIAKALLIVLVFMHVGRSPPLTRLVLAAGLLGLAILFTLTLSDYWSRHWLAELVSHR